MIIKLLLLNFVNLYYCDIDHHSPVCNIDEDVKKKYIEIDDIQNYDIKRHRTWGYCDEENMYICSNGKKINCNLRCNGINDCGQFSDEGIFGNCWFGELIDCFDCEIIGETTDDFKNCREPKLGLTEIMHKCRGYCAKRIIKVNIFY